MKKFIGLLLLSTTLVACSEERNSTVDNEVLTKSYVVEHAEIGLTYDEVRERFGKEELSEVVDMTETWLYDDTAAANFDYEKTLEVVAFDAIKSGDVEAQLFINFIDEKVFMYSYFYLGEDGKIYEYEVTPDREPLDHAVSD